MPLPIEHSRIGGYKFLVPLGALLYYITTWPVYGVSLVGNVLLPRVFDYPIDIPRYSYAPTQTHCTRSISLTPAEFIGDISLYVKIRRGIQLNATKFASSECRLRYSPTPTNPQTQKYQTSQADVSPTKMCMKLHWGARYLCIAILVYGNFILLSKLL